MTLTDAPVDQAQPVTHPKSVVSPHVVGTGASQRTESQPLSLEMRDSPSKEALTLSFLRCSAVSTGRSHKTHWKGVVLKQRP